MKTKRIIGLSVLPAIIASCFLSGCATSPVGELTTSEFSEEKGPGMKRTQEVRQTISPVKLDTRRGAIATEVAVEPVAEQIYYRPAARGSLRGAACEQPFAPYGPNSPISPSQWY